MHTADGYVLYRNITFLSQLALNKQTNNIGVSPIQRPSTIPDNSELANPSRKVEFLNRSSNEKQTWVLASFILAINWVIEHLKHFSYTLQRSRSDKKY